MEFTNTTLKDISIGKGSYGIGAPAVPFSPSLYTYLRITDINDDGTVNMDDLKSVDDDKAAAYLLSPNDIVFARTGASTGRNYFYDGTDGEFVYAGFLIKFSVDKTKVNPKFVKYYCLSDRYRQWVQSFSTGSTRGNMNAKTFGDMPIAIPPRIQQDGLVKVLSDIDKKVAINQKVIKNIRRQLQVIFENMFYSDDSSEWPIRKLGEFLDLDRGLSYKGKFLSESEGVPMLNLGNILPNSVFRAEKLKFYTGEYRPKHVIKPGDIIVANTDLTQAREVLGSAIRVPDLGYPTMICSHHISIVKNSRLSNNFILGLLNMPKYRERVAGFATGTTVLALPNDTILNCEFHCPPEKLFDDYDLIANKMYKRIEEVRLESDNLREIKAVLLPRLISGQIDLSEVTL